MLFLPFDTSILPNYQTIRLEHVEAEISQMIAKNLKYIEELLNQNQPFNWDNLMQPLEEMNRELTNYWSPIAHIHAVLESEPLRQIYNKIIPLITEYHSEVSQNEKLYQSILAIHQSEPFKKLSPAQQKIIENDIRDFQLAGIHLPSEQKAELRSLQMRLTKLMTVFSENLLDATDGWYKHIKDENEIDGLPLQARQIAKENAKEKRLEGFVFNLEYSFYSIAMRYLKNRDLRKELYEAYSTRASDQGPNKGKWDNTPIMEEILMIRYKIAKLIDYPNYAAYSLVTKMAKKTESVLSFLNDLLVISQPIAKVELNEVAELAKQLDNLDTIAVWDTAYYSEKLQEKKYRFNQEEIRPYFPINKVFEGMFTIINRIFDIHIKKQSNVNVWHPDVEFFAVYSEDGELCGGFYTDLYARPHKREGAWMDDCHMRQRKSDGSVQLPVAYLTCNFMPPVDNKPGLLTHDDVLTLFHEFGHCLHHLLTKVDYPSVSGINGVAWDAVEFPSQFMENFCWEKESLKLISGHYETGETLPASLYQHMLAAKHFQTGMHLLRQIELALFDFRIHIEYQPGKAGQIQSILDDVRKQSTLLPVPTFNRFQHSFSHIFAGSYAAGYYSYKWAEVLSSDAYSLFEEKGIFDKSTGASFKKNILEVGGVRDPMVSFIAFRGREPKLDALLKHSGIKPN